MVIVDNRGPDWDPCHDKGSLDQSQSLQQEPILYGGPHLFPFGPGFGFSPVRQTWLIMQESSENYTFDSGKLEKWSRTKHLHDLFPIRLTVIFCLIMVMDRNVANEEGGNHAGL